MDYWCMLGSLGNSTTASGHSDSGGMVGPSYSLGRRTFFFEPAVLLSTLTPLLFTVSVSYFILAVSILTVSMRGCLEKLLSYKFPIAILNGTCSLRSAKTAISSGSRVLFAIKKNEYSYVPFSVALEKVQFVHQCCPQHLHLGTARMK